MEQDDRDSGATGPARPAPLGRCGGGASGLLTGLLAALCLTGACLPSGTNAPANWPSAGATPGVGDVAKGEVLFRTKGCTGCHRIGGQVSGAAVGPDLRGLNGRPTIAGVLPNTAENLWTYLEHPPRAKPGTQMPRLPLTGPELNDLVAYLRSLP